jgi:hypothetical protein
VLEAHVRRSSPAPLRDLADVLAADAWARARAREELAVGSEA